MVSVLIKEADVESIPYLVPLIGELGYPTDELSLKKRFARFIKQEGSGVAIAYFSNTAYGFIAYSRSQVFVADFTRFHIEALVVSQKFRGSGVGRMLIEHIEEKAKNYYPAIVDLVSGVRRQKDGTHIFYEKLGYKNDGFMAKIYLRKAFERLSLDS